MDHFDALRLQLPATKLKKQVFIWWVSLPNAIRPTQLAKQFPHIVNRIVDTWDDFYACEQYLHDLLHERERAHRRGFQPDINDEIRQLYNTLLRKTLVVSAVPPAGTSAFRT